jgi:hypothetical protein
MHGLPWQKMQSYLSPCYQRRAPSARLIFTRCTAFLLAVLAALSFPAAATPPEISLIQPFSTNQLLLHFDTDPNRLYVLQYTDKISTNGFAGSTWSNLFSAPISPFPGHYIIPDYRTNKFRFYRLQASR